MTVALQIEMKRNTHEIHKIRKSEKNVCSNGIKANSLEFKSFENILDP